MLEILGIIWFARKLGRIAEEKGRQPGGYKFLGVASWIGGEIIGAVIGASTGDQAAVYVFAILGAIISNVITYSIVSNLEPVSNAHYVNEPQIDNGTQEVA